MAELQNRNSTTGTRKEGEIQLRVDEQSLLSLVDSSAEDAEALKCWWWWWSLSLGERERLRPPIKRKINSASALLKMERGQWLVVVVVVELPHTALLSTVIYTPLKRCGK